MLVKIEKNKPDIDIRLIFLYKIRLAFYFQFI